MSDALLTVIKVALVALSIVLIGAAISAFAAGQQLLGAVLVLVVFAVAFVFAQLA